MEDAHVDGKEKWSLPEWQERARDAELRRELYRNTILERLSPDLHETVHRLKDLLDLTQQLADNPLFSPAMQKDLFLRTRMLLGEVARLAYPKRRGRLPSASYVRSMCDEVRELLGPLPAMYRKLRKDTSFGLSDTWAAFQKDRGEFLELWVRSRMPIGASPTQVERAVAQCRALLRRSYDSEASKVTRIATGELSMQMVAIVLDTSMKEVRKKKRQGAPRSKRR